MDAAQGISLAREGIIKDLEGLDVSDPNNIPVLCQLITELQVLKRVTAGLREGDLAKELTKSRGKNRRDHV